MYIKQNDVYYQFKDGAIFRDWFLNQVIDNILVYPDNPEWWGDVEITAYYADDQEGNAHALMDDAVIMIIDESYYESR